MIVLRIHVKRFEKEADTIVYKVTRKIDSRFNPRHRLAATGVFVKCRTPGITRLRYQFQVSNQNLLLGTFNKENTCFLTKLESIESNDSTLRKLFQGLTLLNHQPWPPTANFH